MLVHAIKALVDKRAKEVKSVFQPFVIETRISFLTNYINALSGFVSFQLFKTFLSLLHTLYQKKNATFLLPNP
jgi:hypothetical protein